MAGIYIHIPFCKQACTYCDFHFSTTRKHQSGMVDALMREMELRRHELGPEPLQSVYFGGGTPSVLTLSELEALMQQVQSVFGMAPQAEITLEANPDDLDAARMHALRQLGINRLSVGVQTFDEASLQRMHRAHNAQQAEAVVQQLGQWFTDYSIDLMYGLPGLSLATWDEHIDRLINARVPHISCYALTVEPRTALQVQVTQGEVVLPDEAEVALQFERLQQRLTAAGYDHYEVSNFALPGQYARHNTAYWQGQPYLGIGPSAHSYNGQLRQWNVSNNLLYMQAIAKGECPLTSEQLQRHDRYNEYVMTGLRTQWGIATAEIAERFGHEALAYFLPLAQQALQQGHLVCQDGIWRIPAEARFLSDGIAAELFWLPEA